MRFCSRCKIEKPIDQFHKGQRWCKKCKCEVSANAWASSEELRKLKASRQAARRVELRLKMLGYLLAHPCVDCGEEDPVVLDFDHLLDKFNNISIMVNSCYTWARIEVEIAKCDVVCANCHRRRSAARHGGWMKSRPFSPTAEATA